MSEKKKPLPPISCDTRNTFESDDANASNIDYSVLFNTQNIQNIYELMSNFTDQEKEHYFDAKQKYDSERQSQFPIHIRGSKLTRSQSNTPFFLRDILSWKQSQYQSKCLPPLSIKRQKIDSTQEYLKKKVEKCYAEQRLTSQINMVKQISKSINQEEKRIMIMHKQTKHDRNIHHKTLSNDFGVTNTTFNGYEKTISQRYENSNLLKCISYKFSQIYSECIKLEEHLKELVIYKIFLNSTASDEMENNIQSSNDHMLVHRIELKNIQDKMSDVFSDSFSDSDEITPINLKSLKQIESSVSESPKNNYYASFLAQDITLHSSTPTLVIPEMKSFLNTHDLFHQTDEDFLLENELVEFLKDHHNKPTPLRFQTADEFIDILFDLEFTSLSLIENLYEENKIYEKLSSIQSLEECKIAKRINGLQSCIKKEEDCMKRYQNNIDDIDLVGDRIGAFTNLESYRGTFNFGKTNNFKTINDVMDSFIPFIQNIFEKFDNSRQKMTLVQKDIIQILGDIERQCDSLFLKIKSYPRNTYLEAWKGMITQKRYEARLKLKDQNASDKIDRINKVIKKSKQKIIKLSGRRLMTRSKPLDCRKLIINKK